MALTESRMEIDLAAKRAGRNAADIKLVAVSKQQPIERVRAVLENGHRVFGENRVQEARQRWGNLRPHYPDLELRLIGPLQTNKIKQAFELFDVIESLDRKKLAEGIAENFARLGVRPRLYVQVNTGEEPQKSGVAPKDTARFVDDCRNMFGLSIEGLMVIPPAHAPPAPHFALLAKLAGEADVKHLSMGMSADFEQAIQLGATSVRLGSKVFGARQPQKIAGSA
jgi:pyridoxal phosphate enzyme (YggS family)